MRQIRCPSWWLQVGRQDAVRSKAMRKEILHVALVSNFMISSDLNGR